jgi:hypothetical protein
MAYSIVLTLHSLVRWVVLIAAVAATLRALVGWLGRREWTGLDNRLGRILTGSLDVQFLLGLILYIFLSPNTRAAFQDLGAAMSNGEVRFWALDHVVLMLVAVVLGHVGRALSRRAEEATAKHQQAAILYGLATVAMLLAIPWPFLSYGRPLLRLVGLVWP